MADLSITAANVDLISGPTGKADAGEAITPGQGLYLNSADGKLYKAVATSLAGADFVGLALSQAAGADQPVIYAKPGAVVDLGAGTQGLIYIVSGTAGGLSPHTDVTTPASGEFCTVATIARANSYHIVVGNAQARVALA